MKAVQILSQAIRDNPQSFTLLHVQCDFLRSKGKSEWAVQLAQQAVNCAPSEFITWAKLTEVYIELGQYESALLTLNSCPMFTYNDRDLHRMPTPSRTHLPTKQYIMDSQILEGDGLEEDTDPALSRLPAPALRGTFAKAYELLCRLVSDIGWDELLKTRSAVFVMEEEYRTHRAHNTAENAAEDDKKVNGVGHEDGTVRDSMATAVASEGTNGANADADDDASTRGIVSPPGQNSRSPVEGNAPERPSTDSVKEPSEEGDQEPPPSAQAEGVEQEKKSEFANGGGINKPTEVANDTEEDDRRRELSGEATALNSKRLCERWLDNMFMCLYEVSSTLVSCFSLTMAFRISASGQSSVPKSPISKIIDKPTEKQVPNGKYSGIWAHDCCTRRKRKRRTNGV